MATKRPMSASLPPIRCTQEFRDKLEAIAEAQGKSLGDVTREAIALFLFRSNTDCIENNTTCVDLPQEAAS